MIKIRIAPTVCLVVCLLPPSAGYIAWAEEPGQAPVADRCSAPAFRAFDFWLGRWEVHDPDGELIGHNEIRRISGGCGILEHWRGVQGGTGMSINAYDPDLGQWTQRWVGNGATLWLEGGLEGERMVLAGAHPRTTPRGDVLDRLAWTPLGDGGVQQTWEISTDGGESWIEVFRGYYQRAE